MYKLRDKYHNKIKYSVSKMPITVLIGARQIGKTSLMKSLSIDMNSYDVDGQLPETVDLFSSIDTITELLSFKLNKELDGLFIIDEFQYIPDISSKLKILADHHPKLKILCSGSSSLEIIQKVKESLAGRVRMIYVNSLSFSENILFEDEKLFTEYQKYSADTNIAVIDNKIKNLLRKYLVYGGMPRMALESDPREKIQILDDIYKTYLMRDVRDFIRNEDSVGFNKLLKLLALQISNLVNVNELSKTTGLTYNKCVDYIYLLEQMFIIKMISPYDSNKKKSIKKMKKIYFLDLGLRNIIINNFNDIDSRQDNGALFENFVFLELIKHSDPFSTINFFRTRDGAEVDFVINDMFNLSSFEVKYKELKTTTSYRSLTTFNNDEDVKKSYVVNMSLNDVNGIVRYLPAHLIEKVF
jgi:predicted AAA+ superfamily ATPase